MMAALRVRVRVPKPVLSLYRSPPSNCSTLSLLTGLCSFSSSIDIDCGGGGGVRRKPVKGAEFTNSVSENARTTTDPAVLDDNYGHDLEGYNYDRYREEDKRRTHNTSPPEPIPNRPLRAEKSYHQSEYRARGGNHGLRSSSERGFEKSATTANQRSKPVGLGGNNRTGRQTPSTSSDLFLFDKFGNEESTKQQYSPYPRPQSSPPFTGEKQGHDFLEKFKLGYDDKGDRHLPEAASATPLSKQQQEEEQEMKAAAEKLPPPQDADEIFKKMKETGLIPNAVAMLDGLCKDGLVQEAMKLFGLMREKGTIPEVVIYTAVVDGFCKAQKLDDAKRIFRKMQSNGISANAYSYTVLIHGLYRGNRLEDALDFCVEMLEAGHSPNLATFAGLVDGFCREKGLEEARSIIGALMQKGFSFDEKLVREYLDRKGPFLPLVWEAIFGKKSSDRSF